MPTIISPSILSIDFGNLRETIELLNQSECDWIHLDIMDGVFVPNISFGFPIIETIKKYATKPLDVHLMIENPDKYIDDFKKAGSDILTVHYEACTHLHRTVQYIKYLGMKAGVAINPHTPVSLLEEIICDVDMVLNMTVNPGYGGQKFIESSYHKLLKLQKLIADNKSEALIQIDGGVNLSNIGKLKACGVNSIVAGSFVFSSDNPIKTISELKINS
jgi:ribulose-phosphate 3-epimerase